MAYIPPNPNGQATSANSAPVVIASDQSPIVVSSSNQTAVSTVSWTSATAVNTTLMLVVTDLNVATLTMSNTATMTAGVLTFEVSPDSGTSWFSIAMARIDSYTVETTYTLNTIANRAWSTSVDAFTNFRVRLSTAITGTGTATLKIAAQSAAVEPIVTIGQSVAASLQMTVGAALPAGTNQIGKVTILPQSSGAATTFTLLSAATTNATLVKASAGALFMITATNNSGTVAFLKFYNKASAPTVGTDTPVLTFLLPSNGGLAVPVPVTGIQFSTGIGFAITGLAPATDTTAVTLNQVQVNGAYF
ncbi:MAG: hypothetical protein EOT05_04190 [Candidatus Microsaccharimonas sossegonensis]|uniref:Uncharacterized protein n=1 Tax=Candidatus Microsaccharimonas sossegonensis TaxID=2506948 RepID=A0A4Q0AIJ9_9BACT|nr:MAG: hypothetical protein EOT05_04190 [Candidatus Microsaccharimonas sossegonensis]